MAKTEKQVIWKPYPDYPFIEANQFGEIRVKDRVVMRKDGSKLPVKGYILKQYLQKNGYMRVHFSVNHKMINLSVHRVVASCFLPNPNNLPEINHIDNDPTNNAVSNLEWCTHKYNMDYREKFGTSAKEATKVLRKPVFAVNLKTFKVLQFESQSEAARQLGIHIESINRVLKGKLNQTGGYWFTEDENEISDEKIRKIKVRAYSFSDIIAINLQTLEVLRFKSQSDAARHLGVNQSSINAVVNDRCKTAGGYWFCRVDLKVVEKVRAKFGDEISNFVRDLIHER